MIPQPDIRDGVALVTGASGFVGRQLTDHLLRHTSWTVIAQGRTTSSKFPDPSRAIYLDVTDLGQVREALTAHQPDYIFHLAAATPPAADNDMFVTNVLGAANVLESIYVDCRGAAVLIVGSDAQYGPQQETDLPTNEDAPMRPTNGYGRSKVLQEECALAYHGMYGLRITCARPFNIVGPGQSANYVLSSLARKVALAEAGKGPLHIRFGSATAQRDFTDVRDVVRAYFQIILAGRWGQAFNVGSRRATSIGYLAEAIQGAARIPVILTPDEGLSRRTDAQKTMCDYSRLSEIAGWSPAIPLDKTIEDTLEYWRQEVSAGRSAEVYKRVPGRNE